jgi:hypothetical protein
MYVIFETVNLLSSVMEVKIVITSEEVEWLGGAPGGASGVLVSEFLTHVIVRQVCSLQMTHWIVYFFKKVQKLWLDLFKLVFNIYWTLH